MPYIIYDRKKEKFYATDKRPTNQNSRKTVNKIALRLTGYAFDNPDITLTALQSEFVKIINKKQKKYNLSKYEIDIAHGIAISKIIDLFVQILNDPKSLKLKDANNFGDAILSTESPSQEVTRDTLRDFFNDVKDGDDSEDLCDRANHILKQLNKCSRNLAPGYASVNRAAGKTEDPHFTEVAGNPRLFKKIEYSKRVSTTFKKLPGCSNYEPRTEVYRGKTALLSSSVFAKKSEAYVTRASNSDSEYELVQGRRN